MKTEEMKLPDKAWELLQVAVDDLKATELLEDYHIAMSYWHEPSDNNSCAVCMAGAVIRSRLGGNRDKRISPTDFPIDIERKLVAIDDMRQGKWHHAFRVLQIAALDHYEALDHLDWNITSYNTSRKRFFQDMEFNIAVLKGFDL